MTWGLGIFFAALGIIVGTLAGWFASRLESSRRFLEIEMDLQSQLSEAAAEARKLRAEIPRARNVDLVVSQYAKDRVLALLERQLEKGDAVSRPIALARALDSGTVKPNFPWTDTALALMGSWQDASPLSSDRTLSVIQLMEVSRRAEAFVATLQSVPSAAKEDFTTFMSLGDSETPEQATRRLRRSGGDVVLKALIAELAASTAIKSAGPAPLAKPRLMGGHGMPG